MAGVTYYATGAVQEYVVPVGVSEIDVELRGAAGGRSYQAGTGTILGGRGNIVTGRLSVTPGETLYLYVGGAASREAGGWNGGGTGWPETGSDHAGGGGGASDIRRGGQNLGSRIAVAAGGGGSGRGGSAGGAAGYPQGAPGTETYSGAEVAQGGSQTAGGHYGGTIGQGGSVVTTGSYNVGCAGGGGGYYGGGAGGGDGTAQRQRMSGAGGSSYPGALTSYAITTTTGTSGRITLTPLNSPPSAPTLTSMATGQTIDRGVTNRATWAHSDPNGDPQSAYRIRHRLIGAPTWTEQYVVSTAQWHDFAAGTFAVGSYEWQVQTSDTEGLVSPWSSSGFFDAADAPNAPSILEPANGGTIAVPSTMLTWSVPTQDTYQVRRVADAAGTPDPSVPYLDTAEVHSPSVRSTSLLFETNDRAEHVQVRIKEGGLWSAWASVRVVVDYPTPAPPTLALTPEPATSSMLVTITNPTPGEGQAETVHNEIHIDDGDGEQRRAAVIAVNGTWRYWTPRSGRDYDGFVRVVAFAANQAGTSS